MFVTFHKEVEKPKNAILLPLKVFNQEVQDSLVRYSTHYDLINSGYIEVNSNEYYLFLFVKDIRGVYHRIDVELWEGSTGYLVSQLILVP